MAAKIKHTQSASRRVNIYRRFPSEGRGGGVEREKKKNAWRASGWRKPPPPLWEWETVLRGMVVMQVQEVERHARGGERTRVRDTLPRVVLTIPPPPFHPRPLSCIHYFLVDADDDDDNDGSSGGGDGDGDDDDNYDENRLLSRGRLSPPLSYHRPAVSLFRVRRF